MSSLDFSKPLLIVENLTVTFETTKGLLLAVNDVSFRLHSRECLGIVGESGSGKSVTCLSLLNLIDKAGKIVAGKIFFEERNLCDLSQKEWQKIRGTKIGMIFQDPMTSLNPLISIGKQIFDVLAAHSQETPQKIKQRAIQALEQAGIPNGQEIYGAYPFQLSGGLRQRVIIAMAISLNPAVIIADEPTTALDVSVQTQILDLFHEFKKLKHFGMIFVSHDLHLIASIADTIMVMYAGQCVEMGPAQIILNQPLHPYSAALIKASPDFSTDRSQKLFVIPGTLPDLTQPTNGCLFFPRCNRALDNCAHQKPALSKATNGVLVRCFNPLPASEKIHAD